MIERAPTQHKKDSADETARVDNMENKEEEEEEVVKAMSDAGGAGHAPGDMRWHLMLLYAWASSGSYTSTRSCSAAHDRW